MIGIDLVKISRISSFASRFGKAGLARFLTPNELQNTYTDQSLAGIWAAKEAVSKALGCGIGSRLSFQDIEIVKDELGKPVAKLSDQAKKRFGVELLHLSISHEKEYAVAVALITH